MTLDSNFVPHRFEEQQIDLRDVCLDNIDV